MTPLAVALLAWACAATGLLIGIISALVSHR